MRLKVSAYLTNGRIVDREPHIVDRDLAMAFAAPQRFPPFSDCEIVEDFDQTESCRKAQNQTAILLHQVRKLRGDPAEIGDAV